MILRRNVSGYRVYKKAYAAACGQREMPKSAMPKNVHRSPFGKQRWVFATVTWAVLSIVFNLYQKLKISPPA